MTILQRIKATIRNLLPGREQRDPNVMTVTDADIDRQAEELARRELNVSAAEAYAMLEHGELEDTALAIELRMLDHLRRKPRYRAKQSNKDRSRFSRPPFAASPAE